MRIECSYGHVEPRLTYAPYIFVEMIRNTNYSKVEELLSTLQ